MLSEVPNTELRNWIFRQLLYSNALDHLDELFQSFRIRYMPIKGACLIRSGLASAIDSRTMVDIDLLVKPCDFETIVRNLSAHPLFEPGPPDPWFFEQPFTFTNGEHTIKLELHYQLNREERFHLPTEELFRRGREQSTVCFLPSPEDALIIHICHTLVHSGYGLAKTTYEEIGVLCSESGFKWKRFFPILKSTGIEPYGFALLRMYREKKQIRIPVPSEHKWADLLFRMTPDRQNLRKSNQLLYRGCIEPLFTRHPIRLMAGWVVKVLRKKTALRHTGTQNSKEIHKI
jgi:hypothetical protein